MEKKEIGKSANDYLYLALLDHLSFALKRAKKRSIFEESIDWEVTKKILSQLLQNWVRSLGKGSIKPFKSIFLKMKPLPLPYILLTCRKRKQSLMNN